MVRMIVRIPSESADNAGRTAAAQLAAKLIKTTPAIILFCRDGGIITARNMPKRATLNALTIRSGSIFPAAIPRAVPAAQQGDATSKAPKVYQGFKKPGFAMEIPKISSVIPKPVSRRRARGVSGDSY